MDILSNKGRETVKQEQRAMEIIGAPYIETPKGQPSDIDGFFIKDNAITGVYEVKCRTATYEQMVNWGSWLITQDKIYRGSAIARMLRVSFYGILYLVPDDKVLLWKLADENGNMLYSKCERTETQETINGGKIIRLNAFYDMKDIIKCF